MPFKNIEKLNHFVQKHFVLLLLLGYGLAAFFPWFGLQIRDVSLGKFAFIGEQVNLSMPIIMLSFLLFNAGFGIKITDLRGLWKKNAVLVSGLIGNVVTPVIFIILVWTLISHWHNPDEAQNILVGLAIIASMPIAGSSTAWTQNANGNLALSVGLVLFSTILSPLLTPVILHSASWITTGDYSEDLTEIAHTGTKAFLILSVAAPVIVGLISRIIVKEKNAINTKSWLKLVNSVILLLLIYSNAAVSLPQTIANPDWDLLALILFITVSLCIIMFASGYFIARIFNSPIDDKTALLFGLGMNNNGTGLVLASMQLADHPAVLLPIIFYNLIQHLVAGAVFTKLFPLKSNGQITEHELPMFVFRQ